MPRFTSPSSSSSSDEPKKRSRVSKPKVRTGCITCKIRRVKCDEVAPSCNRCTSTGRKCDGYGPRPKPLPINKDQLGLVPASQHMKHKLLATSTLFLRPL
ncbi:hypothetical protein Golomagni_07605, partial [Golovinomyces magnicellulatus]